MTLRTLIERGKRSSKVPEGHEGCLHGVLAAPLRSTYAAEIDLWAEGCFRRSRVRGDSDPSISVALGNLVQLKELLTLAE